MIKVESLINTKGNKSTILVGDIGRTEVYYIDRDKNIPVWFFKEQREFYWFPVWMSKTDFKILNDCNDP